VEASHGSGLPRYDPGCYLCPGNARANGERNLSYETTYAFDNDFPALLPAGGAPLPPPPADDLFVTEPQSGRCRVVCFSPRHDLTLAQMDAGAIRAVVDTWADEVDRLARDGGVGYVQVFENKGAAMGCSNPHPHGQVWASAGVPHIPTRKLEMQRRYLERHARDLLGDYLQRELDLGERLVCRNDAWVALVPFWAVWPFETMLVPVRPVNDLRALSDTERGQLADILRRLTVRYDNLFQCSFPYSMGWHGAPTDGREHPGCRLHAVYFPPLLRSATVRKFLVGYEMTGEPQRDITAEAAAARLRAQSEVHYLDLQAGPPEE
jgi:UDPglucose--hexose-1-phosphate uridylyltransferase